MMHVFRIHIYVNRLLTALLPVMFILPAAAQQTALSEEPGSKPQHLRYVLKAGSPLSGLRSGVLGYEIRLSQRKSVTFSAQYVEHGDPSKEGIFHGDIRTHYIKQTYALRQAAHPYTLIDYQTDYFGVKQLPIGKDLFPVSSLTFDLGWRLTTEMKKRWYGILEPGLTATMHQYFRIRHTSFAEPEEKKLTVVGDEGFVHSYIEETKLDYVQTREMRQYNDWLPGVSYRFGVGYRFSKRVSIELQGGGTVLFGKGFAGTAARQVKAAHLRYGLMACYAFN